MSQLRAAAIVAAIVVFTAPYNEAADLESLIQRREAGEQERAKINGRFRGLYEMSEANRSAYADWEGEISKCRGAAVFKSEAEESVQKAKLAQIKTWLKSMSTSMSYVKSDEEQLEQTRKRIEQKYAGRKHSKGYFTEFSIHLENLKTFFSKVTEAILPFHEQYWREIFAYQQGVESALVPDCARSVKRFILPHKFGAVQVAQSSSLAPAPVNEPSRMKQFCLVLAEWMRRAQRILPCEGF